MTAALPRLLLATLLLTATPAGAARGGDRVEIEVEVRPGDSLSGIASRHGVSIEDLRRWNRRKVGRDDLIRAGDHLVLHVSPDAATASAKKPAEAAPDKPAAAPSSAREDDDEVWYAVYRVKSGDTLGRIAKNLAVSIEDLQRWNHLGKAGAIRAGQILRYARTGPRPPARSHGRTTAGTLENGVHLGKGPGYRLRFPKNAYGLPAVNRTLKRCAARMRQRFPGTADILIGDLSRPNGGRFPPHVSHQSGRDADVGYYLAGNIQNATMYRVRPEEVDYEKTWELTACFLSEDRVVRIFIDKGIQTQMVRYLRDSKRLSARQIDRLFAVASEHPDDALIQHAPKHDTHLHVRFACPTDAPDCAEDPGERPFKL